MQIYKHARGDDVNLGLSCINVNNTSVFSDEPPNWIRSEGTREALSNVSSAGAIFFSFLAANSLIPALGQNWGQNCSPQKFLPTFKPISLKEMGLGTGFQLKGSCRQRRHMSKISSK